VTFLADSSPDSGRPPTAAVAWAVPRRVGTAVARNRTRRRLRSILVDAHRERPLPAGRYVFHVEPAAASASFASLSAAMAELLAALRAAVAP